MNDEKTYFVCLETVKSSSVHFAESQVSNSASKRHVNLKYNSFVKNMNVLCIHYAFREKGEICTKSSLS